MKLGGSPDHRLFRSAFCGALLVTSAFAGMIAAPAAYAQTASASQRSFSIPAQPLAEALAAFGRQSGLDVTASPSLVAGKSSSAVSGNLPPAEALSRLLAGTGLTFRFVSATGVTLERAPQAAEGAITLGPVRVEGAGAGSSGIPASITSDPAATEGTQSYTARSTNSATGLALSLRETPQSVTVFTRSRIEDQALSEITEVLDQTIGITYAPTGALGSDGISFYSRGFVVENFQVDGVPRQTTIYGFEDTTADMAVYDRIEVVRGATGLLNGVGSPAATVNFVRKKPTTQFQAYISGQVGSWDRYRVEGDISGPLSESGHIRGRIAAAYQQNDWFTARTHMEKYVVYGVVEADLAESTLLRVGAQYQRFENEGSANWGLPLFFTDGTKANLPRWYNAGAKWSTMADSDLMVFAALEQDLGGGWNAKLDGEYSRPKYDSTFGAVYASVVDPVAGTGGYFYNARWAADLEQWSGSLRLSGPFSLFGRSHELLLGGSYSKGSNNGPNYPGWWSGSDYFYALPDTMAFLRTGEVAMSDYSPTGGRFGGYSEQLGAYATARLNPHDRVKVILGARLTNWVEKSWDETSSGVRSYSLLTRNKGVFTPYGGIVVDLTDNISAYVSYTDIFNPQSNEDINGDRLAPVEGANYEAGLKAEFFDGRFNASVAVFKIKQNNYALAIPGALTPRGNQAYQAVSGTQSKGVEIEVSGEVLPGWQVAGGYSHTNVKDRDGLPLQTFVPRDSIKVFTSYRFNGALRNLLVGANTRWQGRSYEEGPGPNGETFEQDSLVVVDLMAKYDILPQFTVSLNVNNIFDKKYYSGFSYVGVYGTPRQAILTAKYSF